MKITHQHISASACLAVGLLAVVALAACNTAPQTAEGRHDLRRTSAEALRQAQSDDPTLEAMIGKSAGYAVFPNVGKGAVGSKSKVVCDALLLDDRSKTDTWPTIRIDEDQVDIGHEATVSKVGDEQLFYLQTHGIDEEEAAKLIVNGFIEPIVKELPMEYAVEMNRLIELQMEGSIG